METSVLCRLNSAVEKYGDKIAYKDPENSLTFSQFNDLTRSIGTYLARLVPAGAPVVVMSGRHIFTPACFLGVVRAGCFYAPMDGDMPVTRLNQILGVIKADYMLVDKAHLDIAQGLEFRGTIFVMEDIIDYPVSDELLEQREKTLICTSPLYVIFTSGSTGVPKGVITSHQSLMTYIDSVSKVLDINDTDVLGNQSPLDYIAAIRDIYFPISRGASTFVIPKNEFAVPTALFETLNREKITALCWSVAGVELRCGRRASREARRVRRAQARISQEALLLGFGYALQVPQNLAGKPSRCTLCQSVRSHRGDSVMHLLRGQGEGGRRHRSADRNSV